MTNHHEAEKYLCVDDERNYLPNQPTLFTDAARGFLEEEEKAFEKFFR